MKLSITCLLKSIVSIKYFESDFLEVITLIKDTKDVYTRPLKKLKFEKMARSTRVRNLPKLLLTKRSFDVFILISVK
jgi:hypothetical protein